MSGSILLDQLTCNGTENSLFDCPHRGVGVHNCSRFGDAGVRCNGFEGLNNIGIIAGELSGKIVASGASGRLVGAHTSGGLTGFQEAGEIIASTASVDIIGRRNESSHLGGLVGKQGDARVLSSYANARITANNITNTGGLVGLQNNSNARIVASYSNGSIQLTGNGNLGGLVGLQNNGIILASYANNSIQSVTGNIGKLVGRVSGMIVESYGFSSITGTANNSEGEPPTGVTTAQGLTAINTGATWNQVSSDTLGAWNFSNVHLS